MTPDTTDLREGPDLHPALLPLLPLVGRWSGTGVSAAPGSADFPFAQEVTFGHDGRDFLSYSSRTSLLAPDGTQGEPGPREVGWWRAGPDGTLEVVLAEQSGVLALYYGQVRGVQFEIATDAVLRTASAEQVSSVRRLYGVVEGDLAYAVDVSSTGEAATPRMSARLQRS